VAAAVAGVWPGWLCSCVLCFSIWVGTKMPVLVCSGRRLAGFGGWEGVLLWCGGGRRHRLPVSLRPPLTTGGRCVSVLFLQV
jgi:hypothetical protein